MLTPTAIHVNSTAPFFAKNGDTPYYIEKFDLYCSVISALAFRKNHGAIFMITDSTAAEYYEKIGIAPVWNGIKPIIPDDMDGINPLMFWAGGKLLALREIPAPVIMLDTDFIAWELPELNGNITCAHRENLMPDVYPPLEYFRVNSPNIMKNLDKGALPCNTAFLYLPDEDFKQLYVSRAITFMKAAENCADYLTYMVFAEQRLPAMLAAQCGLTVDTLMDKDRLFFPQNAYTHLWGAKQAMRDNKEKTDDFCARCAERIKTTFPQYEWVIGKIENSER